MIEHQINNDARDRDIQPQRQRPARNSLVSNEVASRCPVKCDEDQWNDDNRQNDVADQDRKIQRSHEALAQKPRLAMVVVIGQIRNQKQCRGKERGNLTFSMRVNATRE